MNQSLINQPIFENNELIIEINQSIIENNKSTTEINRSIIDIHE